MCLHFRGKDPKKGPTLLFRADFWDQKRVPSGPLSATKSLVYCFFLPLLFGPDVLQSGFGVNFYFGPANFRKIAGEFLSEF